MKTKCFNVYSFDELNDNAKENARNWYREGADYIGSDAWDYVREDAKEIGLEITTLDQHRANKGNFMVSAEDCAERVLKNHGGSCETFKTAAGFFEDFKGLERDEDGCIVNDENAEVIEKELLHDILEDYRIMLDKETEYQYSDEAVDDAIRANEYEFSENGKRTVTI